MANSSRSGQGSGALDRTTGTSAPALFGQVSYVVTSEQDVRVPIAIWVETGPSVLTKISLDKVTNFDYPRYSEDKANYENSLVSNGAVYTASTPGYYSLVS